jgi:hypothetical protein
MHGGEARVLGEGGMRGGEARVLGEGGMRGGQARVLGDGGMRGTGACAGRGRHARGTVGQARAWQVDCDLSVQQAQCARGAGMVGGVYQEAKRCERCAVVGTRNVQWCGPERSPSLKPKWLILPRSLRPCLPCSGRGVGAPWRNRPRQVPTHAVRQDRTPLSGPDACCPPRPHAPLLPSRARLPIPPMLAARAVGPPPEQF